MDQNRINFLFNNPSKYTNEYERGLVHGMAFLTEKLIWAEQIYLDAISGDKKFITYTKDECQMHQSNMYQLLNDIIQNYASRSNSFNLINDKYVENWYNNIRKLLQLKPTQFKSE